MNRKLFTLKQIILLALFFTLGSATAQGLGARGEFRAEPVERDAATAATVNNRISYQGVLKENGNPVTGARDMVFRFYTQSDCSGTAVETVTKNGVQVTDGLFGEHLDVTQANFDGQGLWLGVEVSGATVDCQEIMPVPYALSLRPGATVKSTAGTGLFVQSSDTNDYTVALQGRASGSSGINYGVIGQTMSESNWAVGVYGQALGSTGINAGVAGRTDSSSNGAKGVSGGATATSGDTYGVYGTSESSSGTGVYGESYIGVHGEGTHAGVMATSDFAAALVVEGGPGGYAARITGSPQGLVVEGDTKITLGYLVMPYTFSVPSNDDCDESSERARMILRVDTGTLYVCADTGWVSIP